MVDTFDSQHAVEIKELIFPEYNKNKFIYGQMFYLIGDNHKYNIIWLRDFNTWWIITNNNLCTEAARCMIWLPIICVMIFIPHTLYKDWQFVFAKIDTIWYYKLKKVVPCPS